MSQPEKDEQRFFFEKIKAADGKAIFAVAFGSVPRESTLDAIIAYYGQLLAEEPQLELHTLKTEHFVDFPQAIDLLMVWTPKPWYKRLFD